MKTDFSSSPELERLWQSLVASAVLGTQRQPFAWPEASGKLGDFLAAQQSSRPGSDDPEGDLLGAAAIIDLYRRAGRLPASTSQPLPPACDLDDLPRCNPAAAQRLVSLLDGVHAGLLTEWLELAARSGVRIPEILLPRLLDLGRDHPDLVNLILPVMGKRGGWLAAYNPDWEYAAPVEPEEVWQTGKRHMRRSLLQRLRAARPDEGRQLLASTWTEETAADRAAFLSTFETSLAIADEPFLEAALDDRSKEVRRVAAGLLACLPDSHLVQRMARWVQPYLAFEPGRWPGRRARLTVVLPESCDPQWVRNGIDPRPQGQMGERAGWLMQMLACVPPSHWTRQWGKTPVEMLDLAAQSDWKELLHEGWITATLRQREAEWAEALLQRYPERSQMLDALPEVQQYSFLLEMLQSKPNTHGMPLVLSYRRPWSPELTRAALRRLRSYYLFLDASQANWHIRRVLREAGLYMHPDLAEEAKETLSGKAEPASAWEQAVQSLLDLLEFRSGMQREFR